MKARWRGPGALNDAAPCRQARLEWKGRLHSAQYSGLHASPPIPPSPRHLGTSRRPSPSPRCPQFEHYARDSCSPGEVPAVLPSPVHRPEQGGSAAGGLAAQTGARQLTGRGLRPAGELARLTARYPCPQPQAGQCGNQIGAKFWEASAGAGIRPPA